jgi:prefoldin subunit 5
MVAEIKKNKLSVRQTADRVKEIKGKEKEPDVHILTDGQLQGLRDLLGTYLSFGLMFNETPIIVDPSPERWKELASNVKQTLQELTTVRAMFRELDAYLTVQASGQSEKELNE